MPLNDSSTTIALLAARSVNMSDAKWRRAVTLRHSTVISSLIIGLTLLGWDGTTDVSGRSQSRAVVGRCLRTRQTLFLVVRTPPNQRFPEQPDALLAPPGSAWGLPSIQSFQSSATVAGGAGRVIRLVPADTRLVTLRVLRLDSFEGAIISIEARLSTGEIVDLWPLANFEWTLPFAYEPQYKPKEPSPFDARYLKDCNSAN